MKTDISRMYVKISCSVIEPMGVKSRLARGITRSPGIFVKKCQSGSQGLGSGPHFQALSESRDLGYVGLEDGPDELWVMATVYSQAEDHLRSTVFDNTFHMKGVEIHLGKSRDSLTRFPVGTLKGRMPVCALRLVRDSGRWDVRPG